LFHVTKGKTELEVEYCRWMDYAARVRLIRFSPADLWHDFVFQFSGNSLSLTNAQKAPFVSLDCLLALAYNLCTEEEKEETFSQLLRKRILQGFNTSFCKEFFLQTPFSIFIVDSSRKECQEINSRDLSAQDHLLDELLRTKYNNILGKRVYVDSEEFSRCMHQFFGRIDPDKIDLKIKEEKIAEIQECPEAKLLIMSSLNWLIRITQSFPDLKDYEDNGPVFKEVQGETNIGLEKFRRLVKPALMKVREVLQGDLFDKDE
jgi:hypothetical protein